MESDARERNRLGWIAMVWAFCVTSALAQPPLVPPPPPAPPGVAAGAPLAFRVDAVAAEPYGVGRLEVELPPSLMPHALGEAGLGLSDRDFRVLYPIVQRRPMAQALRRFAEQAPRLGGRLGNILGRAAEVSGAVGQMLDRSGRVTIYFLFRGNQPLELTLQSKRLDAIRAVPLVDPAAHGKLLVAWWREYTGRPALLSHAADYPPVVDNYLKALLARRLGLPLPRVPANSSWQHHLTQGIEMGTGTESLRVALERDRMLGMPSLAERADQALPPPVDPAELELPDVPADVAIEPIARRVPAECFYVRFGSFSNFLWLQDLMAQWGGDLQNLVAQRGLDRGVRERFERQLVVQSTVLARLFGETVVADVAVVGSDMFFADGGAYGLLFQARNALFLQADFNRQRAARVAKKDGVTEKTVTLAGKKVSLLASADGTVRSYCAMDGDYIFVTSSETLARRFLETGQGKGALADLRAFRFARQVMPLSRKDTIFIYLSDAFFRNLTGPHYRIETLRRLQALADLELVGLAQLASATERQPGESIAELVAGGFLPEDFGTRPDGSRALLKDGQTVDSKRGYRGAFIPVPDMPMEGVTPFEATYYADFAQHYASQWGRLDPVLIGIQRSGLPENRERIVLDVRMTPFARQHYERLSQQFGPPDKMQLAPIANDLIAVDAVLRNNRVFGGIWGLASPGQPVEPVERIFPFGLLRNSLVGYLGCTGEPGLLLGLLNLRMRMPPDPEGYAMSIGGLWRRQFGPFTVFSYQRDVLGAVSSQLRFTEGARPAQLRVRVADLSEARVAGFANQAGFTRTRETSLGNLRLVHAMSQQLRVPNDACKAAAEALLGARLIDPLGGEYVLRQTPDGAEYWTSTVLEAIQQADPAAAAPPPGYQAPPLNWFRGLDLDAQMSPEVLAVHAQVIMQSAENVPAVPASK